MTKEEMIDNLWGQSNHGTQREDIEAAYNAGAAAEREACTTPPGHAKWHFKQVEPIGTVAARPPDGREFVVKNGDFDTNAGRELLNAMIAALSGP